jgi:hypothetical protein
MSDDTSEERAEPYDPDLVEAENNEDDLAPDDDEPRGRLPEPEPTDRPATAP